MVLVSTLSKIVNEILLLLMKYVPMYMTKKNFKESLSPFFAFYSTPLEASRWLSHQTSSQFIANSVLVPPNA